MVNIVDELVVRLGLDSSNFTLGQKRTADDLKRTKENADVTAKSIEASGKRAAEFFTRMRNEALGFFAAFMGARGLADFTRSMINADAAAGRLAHNLNMSTEDLDAFEGAAQAVGGSTAGMDSSLQGLSAEWQNIILTGHSDVIPYLTALHISLGNLSTGQMRPLTDIMRDLNREFSRMDPARASAFGRMLHLDQGTINFLELAPEKFDSLIEQMRRVGVLHGDQAKSDQELLLNIVLLQRAFRSFYRDIVNDLTPAIVQLLQHWSQWIQDNREWISQNVGKWVREAATEVKNFVGEVNGIVAAMGGWKKVSEEIFAIWAVTKVAGLVLGIGKIAAAFGLLGAGAGGAATATSGLWAWIARLAPMLLMGPAGGEDQQFSDEKNREFLRSHPRALDEHHRPMPDDTWFSRFRKGWQSFFGGGDDQPILDLVGQTEGTDAGRGYNETLGYGKFTGGNQNLTGMSLGQIDELQSKMLADPANTLHSSALGRYQITQTTLRDLIKSHGLDVSAKFDEKMQDMLASTLIRERTAGATTENEFMRALSTIWASLPNPFTGESYYGQRTGTTTEGLRRAMDRARGQQNSARVSMNAPQSTTNDNSHEVHIGNISVNTQAKDARGIASNIGDAMRKYAIVPQSNYGLA